MMGDSRLTSSLGGSPPYDDNDHGDDDDHGEYDDQVDDEDHGDYDDQGDDEDHGDDDDHDVDEEAMMNCSRLTPSLGGSPA